MSLVTSVGRSSGARSEEIRDSSFPGKRRGPRPAREWVGCAGCAPADPALRCDLGRGGGARPLRGSRRPPEGAAATNLLKLAARAGAAPAPAPPPASPVLLPRRSSQPPPPARCAPSPARSPAPSLRASATTATAAGRDGPGRARPPGPAAGMGAQARALLLPLLAQWLLRAAPAPAPAPLTLPLRVAAPTPGPGTPAAPRAAPHADGLALALEPAGGAANFLAMVDNLQGDSGRGYYLEMLIGTPPQKVGWRAVAGSPPPLPSPRLQPRVFRGSGGAPGGACGRFSVAPNNTPAEWGYAEGPRRAGSGARALGTRSAGRPAPGAAEGVRECLRTCSSSPPSSRAASASNGQPFWRAGSRHRGPWARCCGYCGLTFGARSPPPHAVSLRRGLVAGSGGAVPGEGSVRQLCRAAQSAEASWLRAVGAAWPPCGSPLPELARLLPPARPAAQPLRTEPASAHVCVECTKCSGAPAGKYALSRASGARVASR